MDIYSLKITAMNLADIHQLVEKIKFGTIRPEESYEGLQGGESRKELGAKVRFLEHHKIGIEAENAMLQSEVDQLTRKLEEVSAARDRLITLSKEAVNAEGRMVRDLELARARVSAVYTLVANLEQDRWAWWPFCTKATIADGINLALKSGEEK
jgi:hypothetical protein